LIYDAIFYFCIFAESVLKQRGVGATVDEVRKATMDHLRQAPGRLKHKLEADKKKDQAPVVSREKKATHDSKRSAPRRREVSPKSQRSSSQKNMKFRMYRQNPKEAAAKRTRSFGCIAL